MKTVTFDESVWQLVPADPTVEMTINAIKKAKIKYLGHGGYEAIYRAMLAAAPKPVTDASYLDGDPK